MDNADIKKSTDTELKNVLATFKEELRAMRFKLSSGDFKKVREIRVKRKTIARILTELSHRVHKEQV
ncbi:MAG TPA: 50S ribosomal protein L29 [Candidatus Magasanikbacteria bacterium]|nr:50S ribosomal protein L29 [Candidatus Magasanikbacteria bacterium]